MKSIIFTLTIVLFSMTSIGQKLEFASVSSATLDKATAKNGLYAGTFLKGNKIHVLYFLSSKKEGVTLNSYNFSNALKFKDFTDLFVTREQAEKDFEWYIPKEKIDKVATGDERFLRAGAAFGSGMKIEFGKIERHYELGIFTDWEFVQEGNLKPKTGEIWRIEPSGYKTTSDYTRLATTSGFSDDLYEYGNPLLAPASATLLATGVITEKISIKNPAQTNANRVAIMAINGMDFDRSQYNIYTLPYSAISLGSGLGQDNNLCGLFAPLNAPSTVKAHKKLLWKDRKNHFTLMRFSDDYSLVDSVSFLSKLMHGRFDIYNGHGSTFIIGMGKDGFDGWARNGRKILLKKLDAIQITRVKDNQVVYSSYWNEDLIEDKLVVPDGEKKKFAFARDNNIIKEIIPLLNGDDFIFGQSQDENYALQVSPEGELKAYYQMPRIDKESNRYNYQYMLKGDYIYFVINEQPQDLTNDTQVSVTKSGNIITTTVKRLNEVFVQSQVLKINIAKLEMSNALVMDGKDFFTMGSYPALFTEDAIYFTGREKAPKGKKIFVAKIEL